MRLVKIKTGCLLYDRTDEQSAAGYAVDSREVFPAPQNFASLTLPVRRPVRDLVCQRKTSIPRDNTLSHKTLRGFVSTHLRLAASKRDTISVRQELNMNEGTTIARVVSRCTGAE